jgi:cytochrome d ubiquinol oxidase subunit I
VGVSQQYLYQARQLQALSFAIHIPLVCFGIAFPALVLFAEYRYLRTGNPVYRAIARRWSRVMLALFAVGVVTGTILSFELGLLWPVWMQDFGSVFGLAFTLEGFSFFLEAIFMGIYAYGWDRLSPRKHFAAGFPIAFAGIAGSFFVISVNAWMNHPSGFTLVNGRATDVHPWAALFANPMFYSEYIHMYFAAFIVAGFCTAAVYAWGRLRGRFGPYERTALSISATAAAVAAPLQVVIGDWAARAVADYQPVKLASMEGLAQTTRGAAEHVLGWYNGHAVVWGIEIPRLLSILAYHNPNAVVRGLNIVPLSGQPPVNVVRISFQTMVGLGTLFALLGAFYLYFVVRHRDRPLPKWTSAAIVASGPLSVVALIAGWVTTEVGRQPWIVYNVMRVTQAVTGAKGIPVGYATLATAYLILAVIVVAILRRLAGIPLESQLEEAPHAGLRPRRTHARRDGRVHGAGGCRLRRRPVDAAALRPHPGGRDPRPRAARDGAGVGGEPRLADLRAGRGLDRVPGGIRLDHLDAGRAAADRRDRHHLPRLGVRAARARRETRCGGPVRAVVSPHPVRTRDCRRCHRPRPRPRRQCSRRPRQFLARPRSRPDRVARRSLLRVSRRRLPRRRLHSFYRTGAGS